MLTFVIAAIACGVTAQVTKFYVVQWISLDTFAGVLAQLLIAGGLGGGVYLLVTYLFKSEELMHILSGLRRKLIKKHQPKEAILDQS